MNSLQPCSLSKSALSLVQLAIGMGKFAKGDALIPEIQKQNAALVLYSSLLGNNKRKKISDKCAYYHIPTIEVNAGDFDRISSRSGLAFAVTDRKLAEKILEEMNS